MSLLNGLEPSQDNSSKSQKSPRDLSYFELKNLVQKRLLSELDPSMDITRTDDLRRTIQGLFEQILSEVNIVLSRPERARLFEQVAAEILGLGPLQPLLEDDTITEILVNGPKNIYIERKGKIHRVPITFDDNDHVMRIIDRIVSPLGRHIDETNPYISARLADGSRVNAAIPPFSIQTPTLIIRKFSHNPLTVEQLIQYGSLTREAILFLQACVESQLNLIVSGDEGSGRTTLLNVLSGFIPEDQRVVTIESTAELQLRQEHVITLESVPANLDGRNGVSISNLLKLALQLRPDRITLGEISKESFLSAVQTMNSVCFLSTMSASSCRDCLDRLIFFAVEAYPNEKREALSKRQLAAVDVLVHCVIDVEGNRRIDEIAVVEGKANRHLLPVFKANSANQLLPTESLPKQTLIHFRSFGIDLPESVFQRLGT